MSHFQRCIGKIFLGATEADDGGVETGNRIDRSLTRKIGVDLIVDRVAEGSIDIGLAVESVEVGGFEGDDFAKKENADPFVPSGIGFVQDLQGG